MASPSSSPALSATPDTTTRTRYRYRRTSTVSSVAHSVHTAATDLLRKDPPPGFFAATAEVAAQAPTIGEIRRGSFGAEGWQAEPLQVVQKRRTFSQGSGSGARRAHRLSTGERERVRSGVVEREGQGGLGVDVFPALTEECSRVTRYDQAGRREEHEHEHDKVPAAKEAQCREIAIDMPHDSLDTAPHSTDNDNNRLHPPFHTDRKVHTSGYIPPPTLPWPTSTAIALRAFSRWLLTPFGFLLTLYALNVVAWGGMLFLLLCNASPAMCWAPIPSAATAGHHYSLAAALALNTDTNGQRTPRYHNCNDINSPRRIWLEIDSQILNALFCVTGFGLVPWRFRDLWYLLRWRCTSERRWGRERKLYGLRVLAGIYAGWFRLPGSQTVDQLSCAKYRERTSTEEHDPRNAILPTMTASRHDDGPTDIEAGPTNTTDTTDDDDPRLPHPATKTPGDPLTGVRAPPTAPWKLDFFVWSQAINTFCQAGLCGFMWGMTRYNRPSWATGLFIGLGCVIAGVGGLVGFLEGRGVRRVEGGVVKEVGNGRGGEDWEGDGVEGRGVELGEGEVGMGMGCESVLVLNVGVVEKGTRAASR
ncbi:hypothetical protein LTR36_009542 [Oleoguttula mirabilis]|uniref:Uncharacterized protein n=1 Tax=Oleoguttula mirabilis TaxID=1507867 RepID=A0AAV9JSS2_9PEZI|nr:hypothetical protein LTR36_009542 [Oleoguttula mirabilis]